VRSEGRGVNGPHTTVSQWKAVNKLR